MKYINEYRKPSKFFIGDYVLVKYVNSIKKLKITDDYDYYGCSGIDSNGDIYKFKKYNISRKLTRKEIANFKVEEDSKKYNI